MVVNFDSRNKFYKAPFGALKTNEEVTFTLTSQNGVYIDNIRIIVVKNNFVFSEHYLNYDGFSDNFHKFSCTLQFSEVGIYKYYFIINSENGVMTGQNDNGKLVLKQLSESENYSVAHCCFSMWQLTVYDENFSTPSFADGGIMYQIFPDRFKKSSDYEIPNVKNHRTIHKNWEEIPEYIYDVPTYTANDFYCGNLKGIEEQLPYIKDLGVNIIYLNPVFESGANHRYSTADYKKVDPYLGTNEDFSRLCNKAKKMGIKIILDGVFSHTGDDSIYFNKFNNYDSCGAFGNKNSPYRSWYNFGKNDNEYECWWGFKNLPNVNELDPSYMDFITNEETGVLKFWNDSGVSGWRLDVADELPDKFIDALRKSIKSINKDALIIGEVWEDATTKESYGVKRKYLLGEQLDSVMNYPFRTAILNFARGSSGIDFENQVMAIVENYPPPALSVLMNSISTHDTVRALTYLNGKNVPNREQGSYKMSKEEYEECKKRLKICVFLQFSLPGIPCIYYGDEVGVEGFKDPYNRTTYPYGKEDFSILDFHKKIAELRKKYKKDFTDDMEMINAGKNTVCYRRGNLIFIANNSDEAQFVKTEHLKTKIFGEDSIVFNEFGAIIPPFAFAIFTSDFQNERKHI